MRLPSETLEDYYRRKRESMKGIVEKTILKNIPDIRRYLLGLVMKEIKGRANSALVLEIINEYLKDFGVLSG